MKTLFILSLSLLHFGVFCQTSTELLNKVVSKINTVKDYSATAKISANIPMIKILPSQATIYFKQKNKFKVVSKGIVILPKQGFTDLNAFLSNSSKYQSLLGDTSVINSVKTGVITVIPKGDGNDIVLAKLWVDYTRSVIMKSQITSATNGSITTTFTYGDKVSFGLPTKMVFEIDVKKFKLPKSVAADINNTDNKSQKDTRKKGTITVSMSDYNVNQGLSDTVFLK